MGGLFSSPKMPAAAPRAAPAPPARSDAEVQGDMEAERRRRAAASGRATTLLAGTTDMAAGDRRKTLLGA